MFSNKNIFFYTFIIVVLLLLFGMTILAIFTFNYGKIVIPDVTMISIFSFFLFLFLVVIGFFYNRMYFLFLPFILIGFPAAVNDFFPSVIITAPKDEEEVSFSFFTHIDIYLIIGLVKFVMVNKIHKLQITNINIQIKIFIISLTLVTFLGIIISSDIWDFSLIIANSYHLRYSLLILVFMSLVDVRTYQKEILFGFIIAVIFLFLESFAYTKLNGLDRLTSGSLRVNTYANIVVSILLFYFWSYKRNKMKVSFLIILSFFSFVIVFLSETRSALLSLILIFCFHFVYVNLKKPLKFISYSFVFGIFVFYIFNSNILDDRYSISKLSSKITFAQGKNIISSIKIKSSWETNSLITRLVLWDASINMITERPLYGIGVGRWNRYKKKYGFKENVLIDSHNDFLALMSQYGILMGLFFAYFIFFFPFLIYLKLKKITKYKKSNLIFLFIINLNMFICGFTNAGIFKHQAFALLIFNLFCIYSIYEREKEFIKENYENSNYRN